MVNAQAAESRICSVDGVFPPWYECRAGTIGAITNAAETRRYASDDEQFVHTFGGTTTDYSVYYSSSKQMGDSFSVCFSVAPQQANGELQETVVAMFDHEQSPEVRLAIPAAPRTCRTTSSP